MQVILVVILQFMIQLNDLLVFVLFYIVRCTMSRYCGPVKSL